MKKEGGKVTGKEKLDMDKDGKTKKDFAMLRNKKKESIMRKDYTQYPC